MFTGTSKEHQKNICFPWRYIQLGRGFASLQSYIVIRKTIYEYNRAHAQNCYYTFNLYFIMRWRSSFFLHWLLLVSVEHFACHRELLFPAQINSIILHSINEVCGIFHVLVARKYTLSFNSITASLIRNLALLRNVCQREL